MKVEYDIPTDQILALDALLGQKGLVVEDKQPWPSKGDTYYYIDDEGNVSYSKLYCPEDTSYIDINRRNIGNIFKTKEEAEFERERLKVLNELKSLSDDDQEWDNENTHYYIVYELDSDKLNVWYNRIAKLTHPYWFKSEESAKNAIETIGEDRLKKYVLNIKEN